MPGTFLVGGFEGRAEHHSCSLLKVKEWLHYFLQLGLSDQIDLATVKEGSPGRRTDMSLFSRGNVWIVKLERYLECW